MRHLSRVRWFVALAALLATLVLVPSANAVTIVVDGAVADWGSISPVATDSNEGNISSQWNIDKVYWTADLSFLYWRVDTFGNPTGWFPSTGNPFMWFCMDTDNNTGTGYTVTQCDKMAGVDYYLVVQRFGSNLFTDLQACNTGGCASTPAVMSAATANQYTEAKVNLGSLGITETSCTTSTRTINGAVYFDNANTDPDDNVPDSGTFSFNLDCPTSVQLASFNAKAQANHVNLKWATANESNVVGFNVWRKQGRGAWKQLNATTIDAKHALNGADNKYTFTDAAVKAGKKYKYKLEVVMTGDASSWSKVRKVQVSK